MTNKKIDPLFFRLEKSTKSFGYQVRDVMREMRREATQLRCRIERLRDEQLEDEKENTYMRGAINGMSEDINRKDTIIIGLYQQIDKLKEKN